MPKLTRSNATANAMPMRGKLDTGEPRGETGRAEEQRLRMRGSSREQKIRKIRRKFLLATVGRGLCSEPS